jgi:hypothetical protein
MGESESFENYPCRTIVISNLVSVGIYLIGAFIIYQLDVIWLLIYLLYVLWLEIRLLRNTCSGCYYYGKYCAFGKGKISSLFFKKGTCNKFVDGKITWKDIIPDFLVTLIPLIAGIGLLVMKFEWLILILLVVLVLLTTAGTGFVRGKLACRYCKQREIGCPAEQLFNKNKK